MNINPQALRILCFGDSNVWGRSGASIERYPINVRWTGILQKRLGNDYEIIEEGLRSRLTDFDDDDPLFPGRNGLAYLQPCLESHNPLDIVILWLGINNFKARFNQDAFMVAQSIGRLVEVVKTVAHTPKHTATRVILISPPVVREEHLPSNQFTGAGKKSKHFGKYLEEIAKRLSCDCIDMAQYVHAGNVDGVHLEPDQHPIVANIMYRKIKG